MKMTGIVAAVVLAVMCAGTTAANAGWDEGVAAFTSKNYQQAVVQFKEVVRRDPENWEAHLYLGRAYTELGEYARARRSLKQAERRAFAAKPAERKRIWKQLGYTYEKQKKYNKARQAYVQAGEARDAARVERLRRKGRVRTR